MITVSQVILNKKANELYLQMTTEKYIQCLTNRITLEQLAQNIESKILIILISIYFMFKVI